jgi:phage terminase large subunit-like protein
MGISTLTAGYILWKMMNIPNTKALIIATKQTTAQNLINIVKFMNKNLPNWLRIDATNNNALSLQLKNGSYVKASSAAPDSARSESLSILVIDEAAFVKQAGIIWGSAQQTLASGGKGIVISTPNGQGNWYHKQWVEAELGVESDTKFNPIKLEWFRHPERTEKWLEKQKRILNNPQLVAQEILCLGGNSNVKVRNKLTGLIEIKTLEELYNEFN